MKFVLLLATPFILVPQWLNIYVDCGLKEISAPENVNFAQLCNKKDNHNYGMTRS